MEGAIAPSSLTAGWGMMDSIRPCSWQAQIRQLGGFGLAPTMPKPDKDSFLRNTWANEYRSSVGKVRHSGSTHTCHNSHSPCRQWTPFADKDRWTCNRTSRLQVFGFNARLHFYLWVSFALLRPSYGSESQRQIIVDETRIR